MASWRLVPHLPPTGAGAGAGAGARAPPHTSRCCHRCCSCSGAVSNTGSGSAAGNQTTDFRETPTPLAAQDLFDGIMFVNGIRTKYYYFFRFFVINIGTEDCGRSKLEMCLQMFVNR